MAFHIIISIPEHITYLGGNKKDKGKGNISKHRFVSP